MKKLLLTPKGRRLTLMFGFALTLTLGFSLSVSQDGSLAFPEGACADTCTTETLVIDGVLKVCQRCCREDIGTCTMFCA